VFGDCPAETRIAPPDEMRWTWVFHAPLGLPAVSGMTLNVITFGLAFVRLCVTMYSISVIESVNERGNHYDHS
jgi:hypothetical protein